MPTERKYAVLQYGSKEDDANFSGDAESDIDEA